MEEKNMQEKNMNGLEKDPKELSQSDLEMIAGGESEADRIRIWALRAIERAKSEGKTFDECFNTLTPHFKSFIDVLWECWFGKK